MSCENRVVNTNILKKEITTYSACNEEGSKAY